MATPRIYVVALFLSAAAGAIVEIHDEHLGTIQDTEEVKPGVSGGLYWDFGNYQHLDTKINDSPDVFAPEDFDPDKHQDIGLLGEALGKTSPHVDHHGLDEYLGPAHAGEVVHDLGGGLKMTKRQTLRMTDTFIRTSEPSNP